MKPHPYSQYENTSLWLAVEKALSDMKENRDIVITTDERYVIGYFVKALATTIPASVLDREEAIGVHNAINEVCNGIHIEDAEFQTRLGISRSELADVLKKL